MLASRGRILTDESPLPRRSALLGRRRASTDRPGHPRPGRCSLPRQQAPRRAYGSRQPDPSARATGTPPPDRRWARRAFRSPLRTGNDSDQPHDRQQIRVSGHDIRLRLGRAPIQLPASSSARCHGWVSVGLPPVRGGCGSNAPGPSRIRTPSLRSDSTLRRNGSRLASAESTNGSTTTRGIEASNLRQHAENAGVADAMRPLIDRVVSRRSHRVWWLLLGLLGCLPGRDSPGGPDAGAGDCPPRRPGLAAAGRQRAALSPGHVRRGRTLPGGRGRWAASTCRWDPR
jgi:hypothetical protein